MVDVIRGGSRAPRDPLDPFQEIDDNQSTGQGIPPKPTEGTDK